MSCLDFVAEVYFHHSIILLQVDEFGTPGMSSRSAARRGHDLRILNSMNSLPSSKKEADLARTGGWMQPIQSDTSSECPLHRASPSLLALHEKYGARQPLSSMSPVPSLKYADASTENTALISPSLKMSPSVASASRIRQTTKRHNHALDLVDCKRTKGDLHSANPRCHLPPDSEQNLTSPIFSFHGENREHLVESRNAGNNLFREIFRSVHISDKEYSSLPEYMHTVARAEIQNALDSIVGVFEKGQSSITTEDAVSLGLREAPSILHCLATLKILNTGFSQGKMVYEPGKRLEL